MRKIIFSTLFAICLVLPLAVYAGLPEAVSYLKSQTLDDWTAQALVVAGETVDATPLQSFSGSSATDYAKRILSLVAVGENPTSYTGVNLVEALRGLAQNGQIGETSLLNDDAWGIMALRAAGYSTSDGLVKGAAQHLLGNQNADGGWSWGVGFDSDTNDTAAVLMALVEAGYSVSDTVIQNGVAYLATQQNADAGWPYQLPCFWPGCEASDSASTSWVISALTKLKLEPLTWQKSGFSPQDFLLTLQTGEGSFKWQAADTAGSQAMTAYALVSLGGQSYPVARGSFIGGRNTPTVLADLEIKSLPDSINTKVDSQLLLEVILNNQGPNVAQGAKVEITLPSSVELFESVASQGNFDKEAKRWELVRLNNYASAQLSLWLVPREAMTGEIIISASAIELDINRSNNEAAVAISVLAPEATDNGETTDASVKVLGESITNCEITAQSVEDTLDWLGYVLATPADTALWYVDPVTRLRYCLTDAASTYQALGIFGLGITNDDLARLPSAANEPVTVEPAAIDAQLVNRLKGRILLQVESVGEAWYVNPIDGKRYYLKDGVSAWARLADWKINLAEANLSAIAVGKLERK